MKKLIATSLLLSFIFTAPVKVSAETTGAFFNRIYKTSIAASDREALERDISHWEDKYKEAIFVDGYNKTTKDSIEIKGKLIESRSQEVATSTVKFFEAKELYEQALLTVDLDLVISLRADLKSLMYQEGIESDSEISYSDDIQDKRFIDYTGKSADYLRREIDGIISEMNRPSNSFNYGIVPVSYPVKGTITSQFGARTDPINGSVSFHSGLDIASTTGTNIASWLNGTVAQSSFSSGNGNFVEIKSGDISIFYLHMSKRLVEVGDTINQFDVIGEVGSTGRSTGPHLHLSVYIKGIAVDPSKVINNR